MGFPALRITIAPARGRAALCSLALAFLACVCGSGQQFPNPPMIATGVDAVAVIASDFNGDGHQDLAYVTTGNSPTLHILLGNGKGSFASGADVNLPTGTCTFERVACGVDAADFNHDGHVDLLLPAVFATQDGFVFLPGNGDGTFGAPVQSVFSLSNPVGVGLVPFRSTVGDFNGDGKLDIAAPDYFNNNFDIFLGDGTGRFTLGATVQDIYQPYTLVAADINHDGVLDLIAFELSSSWGVSTWIGDGKGNFTNSTKLPQWNATNAIRVRAGADLNEDGRIDLVGPDIQGNLAVLTGNPDGSFNAAQTIASGLEPSSSAVSTALYALDITGSGIPAVIVTSMEGFSTVVASSALHYGAIQQRTAGPFLTPIAIADFNEDKAQDFAVAVEGGIQLFFGNTSGKFPDATITSASPPATFMFAGDFNGDGISDVAALGTDGYFETYLGTTSGTFRAPVRTSVSTTTPYIWMGNQVGDFDGDHHQDMLENGIVLYGNGDGTFAPVTQTGIASVGADGLVADLNNDGRSDFVGVTTLQSAPGANVYGYGLTAQLGNANRTFTAVNTNFSTYNPGQGITTPALLGLGDLNKDGFPDSIVYDANIPEIRDWLGKGDGTFLRGPGINLKDSLWQPQGAGGLNSSIGKGAIVDVDGDGKPDLAFLALESAPVSNQLPTTVLVIEFGDGSGGFADARVIPLSHSFTSMAALKLDHNGGFGFAVADSGLISVIRNLGGRQFSGEDTYSAGSMTGVLKGDFNGDGLDDLLALRSDPNSSPSPGAFGITVLLNQAAALGNGAGLVNAALTVNPAQLNLNQPFTLTATVQSAIASAPSPTGTVDFSALGKELGTVPLTGGTATLQVPASVTQALKPGLVEIVGTYSGDANYASAGMSAVLQILNAKDTTQTTLTLRAGGGTVSSLQAGTFVTLTASVTAADPVKYGLVAFFDGATPIGQVQISSGEASMSTNLLSIGTHSLSAQYLGFTPQSVYQGLVSFLPSTSAAAQFTVTAVATATKLSLSNSSVTAGAVLTLTANVTSADGGPIGGVTFRDGAAELGTLTLDATGQASFTTASLAAGAHSLSAEFDANAVFAASSASPSTVTVNQAAAQLAPTTTQITGLTLAPDGIANAEVRVSGAALPTGTVALIVDGRLAANLQLSVDGTATVPLPLSGSGTHNLVASFAGNAQAAPSASPSFNTTAYVTGADFAVQEQASRIVLGSNSAASMTITVSAIGNWIGTAAFQCDSGVPKGFVCSFSPGMVTGAGTTMLSVRRSSGMTGLALVLVPFFWIIRRPRGRWISLAMLLAVVILSVTSCGTGTSRFRSSVITVEATSGGAVHSVQFDLLTRQ